jgi:cytochrome c biogenesis protein CcmG/thiol:disulfide interchange protein DsbE
MILRSFTVLIGALLLFSSVSCEARETRGHEADASSGGGDAPNFVLKTSDGKDIELKKLSGKVVVVNFWATWCGPCRAEIPGMLEVYDKYKKKGLEIVGISLDQSGWKVINPFVERMNITYPIVWDRGDVAMAYGGIQAIPTTFIIDRKGNVVKRHMGYLSKEAFEQVIQPYL